MRDDGRLQCLACAHRCTLRPDDVGLCGVRQRRGDALYAPFGYVAAQRIRPIETNTVYHVRPGASALILGMYGCDLRCPYCHNWQVSQALREGLTPAPTHVSAAALAEAAVAAGCGAVCAAYNEPMIAAEWLYAVFEAAHARGLTTGVVSDGNTTPEALRFLRPVTDFYRIDLKGFTEAQYATLGGRLAPVLEAIPTARALGYWVEVVTLVVPHFNDDLRGLRALAAQLVAVDPAIPWHLNAFQPRYRWRDRPPQAAGLLVSAAGAAYAKGLRYVYVGNLADRVTQLAHTRCPACQHVVVERHDYHARAVTLRDGCCPACATPIPGVWSASALAA
ncbi:MAG: AmmeMemoRadiSam system radical SAM enzyme [Candidatus Rokubacteria bacterium]|nr:AmmeMemoRadiSam system radical SAM enzyme [Candidatus Rokubacteria bacterium]